MTSKLVRTDKRVADIYAVIEKKQENGIRLPNELREKNNHGGDGDRPGRIQGTSLAMCL